MAERLLHYSAQPFAGPVLDRAQKTQIKPHGLWVSVEGPDDWPSWCKAEGFGIDRLASASLVTLAPDANILRLCSALEIDLFNRDYGRLMAQVDWPAVARRYDGIIIAPYQRQLRLDGWAWWYYGWECASGCIWRARAIADVRPLCGNG